MMSDDRLADVCHGLIAQASASGLSASAEVILRDRTIQVTVMAVASDTGRTRNLILRTRDMTPLRQAEAARDGAAAALQQAMVQVQKARDEVGRALLANVENIVMPLVRDLDGAFNDGHRSKWELLKEGIKSITSGFADAIARHCADLTPTEIRIAKCVSGGMSSKEIARCERLSAATVSKHRENIRRKLGLVGSNANMRSHLQRLLARDGFVSQPAAAAHGATAAAPAISPSGK
jgi:DNA-binding NarL/FixJ family response regulator